MTSLHYKVYRSIQFPHKSVLYKGEHTLPFKKRNIMPVFQSLFLGLDIVFYNPIFVDGLNDQNMFSKSRGKEPSGANFIELLRPCPKWQLRLLLRRDASRIQMR